MTETVVGFIVGSGLGFILGYIVAVIRETKEEVDEVLSIERKHDEQGILEHRIAFNIAFSIMMIFVLYAAYSSFQNNRHLEQNQKDGFALVCQSGQDIRDVQRKTVDAVYALAISVVGRTKTDPPRTPEQVEATNIFISRANEFRDSTYDQIKPTEECMEYVTDDNVDPPTPPQPLLK